MRSATASMRPGRGLGTPDFSMIEQPAVGMINLRGSLDDGPFRKKVEAIWGLSIPDADRFVGRDERLFIWQGPDEWLLVVPDGEQGQLCDKLDAGLDGFHHAVTDVSGNRVVVRIAGVFATLVLSSGCSLDLDLAAFPVGAAKQTLFARTPVTLLRIDATPTFDIHLRRSFLSYLRAWLIEAAGLVVRP